MLKRQVSLESSSPIQSQIVITNTLANKIKCTNSFLTCHVYREAVQHRLKLIKSQLPLLPEYAILGGIFPADRSLYYNDDTNSGFKTIGICKHVSLDEFYSGQVILLIDYQIVDGELFEIKDVLHQYLQPLKLTNCTISNVSFYIAYNSMFNPNGQMLYQIPVEGFLQTPYVNGIISNPCMLEFKWGDACLTLAAITIDDLRHGYEYARLVDRMFSQQTYQQMS